MAAPRCACESSAREQHLLQVAKAQLGAAIASQLETVHVGIEEIASSIRALDSVRQGFQVLNINGLTFSFFC